MTFSVCINIEFTVICAPFGIFGMIQLAFPVIKDLTIPGHNGRIRPSLLFP